MKVVVFFHYLLHSLFVSLSACLSVHLPFCLTQPFSSFLFDYLFLFMLSFYSCLSVNIALSVFIPVCLCLSLSPPLNLLLSLSQLSSINPLLPSPSLPLSIPFPPPLLSLWLQPGFIDDVLGLD